jgi:tetratricopeptide (TPR) repeat protein
VYWNGNFTLSEDYKTFEKTVKDNYTQILPVYNIGSLQEVGQMSGAADKALEKGSATIQRHSMFINGKENVKWIDDAYLMIGKAYFFKREYNSAKRTFEFIITHYNDPKMIFEARLWLIHTLDQSDKFNLSATEVELAHLMVNQGQVGKREHLSFYNETIANHYIILKEYKEALPYLEKAIQYAQTARMRRRLQFITGQIYQHFEEWDKASEYYKILTKKNTTPEIEFNSLINLAKCSAAGSGDREIITRQLAKMLKEAKYEEFRDQIYYALYEVAKASENVEKEKEYLALSVATSVQNDYQKALSALTLAEMLFDEHDYEVSQAYYDTTLQALPRDYPNYDEINKRGIILGELVFNLLLIRNQDSLQMVADMSEDKRNALIDGIIQAIIEEERRQQEEDRRIAELGYRDPRDQQYGQQQTGGWYFYNPQAISMGRREFMRKYGNRKLEDLWIVSNKQSFNWGDDGSDMLGPDGQPIDSSVLAVTDVKKREYYLQFLPLTPEARYSSDSMIAIAYYNVGTIYREKLSECGRAVDAFGTLIERYPDTSLNKNLLLSYYFIIKCYDEMGDDANQNKYTNMLLRDFPNSDMARLIRDPDYYKDLMAKAKSIESLYEKTYLAYKGNQYYLVLLNWEKAAAEFPDHELMPKFEYLRAMSSGKLESRDSTVAQLSRLVMKYPYSEVRPMAETVISALMGKPFVYNPDDTTGSLASMPGLGAPETSIYKTDKLNGRQFLVVYLPDPGDMSPLKIRFIDFNSDNYKMSNLTVNGIMMMNGQNAVVTVGLFNNRETALSYYHHILSEQYIMLLATKQEGAEVFLISEENYPIFYQDGNAKQYKEFFEKYYLQ